MLTFYEISNNQFGSVTRTIDLGGSIQRRGVALGADKTIAFSDQRIFVVASDDEVEGYSDFQGTIHDVVYSHDDIFYLLESTSTGHALVVTDAALAELGSIALNSVDFTESIVHGDVMANVVLLGLWSWFGQKTWVQKLTIKTISSKRHGFIKKSFTS